MIRWTAERYTTIQSVPFGAFANIQNVPLKFAFPLVALLALLVCVRNRAASLLDPAFRSGVAFAIAGFGGCFPRPDIAHIAFALPLACPLLAGCTAQLVRQLRPAHRYAAVAAAIGLSIPSLLSFAWIQQMALQAPVVQTPRGAAAFLQQPRAQELLARIAATPSSDTYFFYPYMPMLPFLSGREHVAKYDIMLPGYTRAAQYRDACLSVMRSATWIVIDREWSDLGVLKQVFPALHDAEPSETRSFEQALNSGFQFSAQDGTFELRRRRQDISEAVCARPGD